MQKSGVGQTEKIMMVAGILVREIDELSSMMEHLQLWRSELMKQFASTLINEYHLEKGGTVVIANERLLADIKKQQDYRELLHKICNETPGAAIPEPEATSLCVIA